MFITVTRDVKKGVHEVNGWSNFAYGMSKVGVTVMTPLQQAELDADKTRSILVNCVSVSTVIILVVSSSSTASFPTSMCDQCF